ncbi:MAG TPA: four-helix bundle copper-binding protein [Bacteroidales bacterium]|nr:four-helix bundle copper-binding protein [Bacteroidales bacterium]
MSHEHFEAVIDTLHECAVDCIHCANACLEEDNVKDLVKCIKLDKECADTCLFTAEMLAGNATLSEEILNLCVKICDSCGDECEKHASHMEHCRICAESCRSCAEECRSLVRVNIM